MAEWKSCAPVASPERDPLTWFGILVPQSLRQAQGSIRAALLMAGETSGLQSRVQSGRAQIQAVHPEKQTGQLKMAGAHSLTLGVQINDLVFCLMPFWPLPLGPS
ncbi:coiled-coil domain-containing protein 115-like [Trichosurus vulpecula]|uniref:coiled-coil domain-containing protein 115-like n=1 Tax=Trichosurus vulpecula TaxID=9337 RepID=UPI00186B21A5|nr:coiled-coil domain-containing protein 115-like [Trichosurus vulpecula]